MNWNPFKKKKPEDASDAFVDPLSLTLSNLKPGYVLDYDLKSWQVKAQHRYDYEGDQVDEWELVCQDDVVFLDREEDDDIVWTLTRKIKLSDLDSEIRAHLRNNDDPPETVMYLGVRYEADSSSVGQFYKDGQGAGQEFIVWDYVDDSEKKVLSIEQWGDDEYEVSVGEVVEEFQFGDILPGGIAEGH